MAKLTAEFHIRKHFRTRDEGNIADVKIRNPDVRPTSTRKLDKPNDLMKRRWQAKRDSRSDLGEN